MRIHIAAIGQRTPNWVDSAYNDYLKRLPRQHQPVLYGIVAEKRSKNSNINNILEKECSQLHKVLPSGCKIIALDRNGRSIDTKELSVVLGNWQQQGQDIAFLIGGPEGLSDHCLQSADELWSLSSMTFPHALVRVILIEQIYRAWSILNGLPYHR